MLRIYRKESRTLLTTEGLLTYSRYILRPADPDSKARLWSECGKKSIAPLDYALGIADLPFKITPTMMLDIAYYAAKAESYEAAEDLLLRTRGVKVNDDTIRTVTNYIGNIVYEEDCRLAQSAMEQYNRGAIPYPQDRDGVLYIEADGAALNTRARDENGSSWRENKWGLVFSSDHIYHWKDHHGEQQHRILQTEYISLIGSAEEFKKHLYALALRNGLGQYKKTVIISDGASWIRNMKEELFPDAQQILDLFHALENIYGFSKVIFRDEKKAHSWAEEMGELLKSGKKAELFHELEKYQDQTVPAGVVNIYHYLKNNEDNIDYPRYQELGYFVGDGAIESGHKTVLQARMKLAGMRWNIETAQRMLSLRAKIGSKLWDKCVVPLVEERMGHVDLS